MVWTRVLRVSVFLVIASIVIHRYFEKELKHYVNNSVAYVLSPWLYFTDNNATRQLYSRSGEKLFTAEQLAKYKGNKKRIYLALLGEVFDVSKGRKYYGEKGGYEFFAGRDASRAFVSGDFTEAGLIDDISGLTYQDYIGLEDWLKFYKSDYKYVGKLIGRYYDSYGTPTAYQKEAMKWFAAAHKEKEEKHQDKKNFPPCNSQWNAETKSGKVWCSKKSGGIARDWVGVPRHYKVPGGETRCACVRDRGPPSHSMDLNPHEDVGDLNDPRLKDYEDCPPTSSSCDFNKP